MNNNKRNTKLHRFLIIAAILGASAILLGAFSAHALEKMVEKNLMTARQLEIFEKAVKYQMYHAIIILVLALFNLLQNKIIFQKSIYLILTGIICFSGSLYWIALQSIIGISFPHFLFWITPLGGILFVAGWIFIAYDTFQSDKVNR